MPKIEAHSGVNPAGAGRPLLQSPAFEDSKHHIKIYQGDCLEILAEIPEGTVDLVFADPPYFLSNGGITCHAGRMVSVNKGEWDKSRGADFGPVRARYEKVHEFNRAVLPRVVGASFVRRGRRIASSLNGTASFIDGSSNMKNIARKEVRRAIVRAKEMLERNTDRCETFEGVLSRGYVRALRTLVALGEKYAAKGRAASKRVD